MEIQDVLQAIKDYGAAIISTISVGGVAAVVGIIVKIKSSIDKTKEAMSAVVKKKDESEAKLAERYSELQTTIQDQNKKIDTLTEEISRVKGNRKN